MTQGPPPTTPTAHAAPATMRASAIAASATHANPAAELQAFFASLLEQQCRLVGAVAGIVYLVASPSRPAGVAASYSNGAATDFSLDRATLTRLERIGAAASEDARGVIEPAMLTSASSSLYTDQPTHRLIGCPLVAAEQVHGACVLIVPVAAKIASADALDRIRLTVAQFEAFLWRQQAMGEAHAKTRLRETLELLDAGQQGASAEAMCALLCHELATRFGCSRVSISLVSSRAGRLKLAGVSGADELDRRGAAAESIEAAMEETADQDVEIIFPQPAEFQADPAHRRVTLAHATLSQKFGPSAIVSLPLRVEGDLVGVVTLEREAADPFPLAAIPLLRLIAEYIGPALWTRRMADRGIAAVARDRSLAFAAALVGPRHTGIKALGLFVLIVFLAAALVPIPGRVSASAETRPGAWRMVPPPFDGYIDSISIRPGDAVRKGDLLATMETRDLLRERARAAAELAKYKTQEDDARSKRLQGDVRIIQAAILEKQTELDLLDSRLERSRILAPIDGHVGRGDLEPLVGAHVDPTTPLFEIVGSEPVVLVIDVDERDIGRVAIGQHGWFAPAATPERRLPVSVTRIRPAAETSRAGNIYRVEAAITDPPPELKPGMTGAARLQSGRTTALALLLRPLVDKARLYLWW